jgi:uncharacterized integral membrane protein (TIGR00697 family)
MACRSAVKAIRLCHYTAIPYVDLVFSSEKGSEETRVLRLNLRYNSSRTVWRMGGASQVKIMDPKSARESQATVLLQDGTGQLKYLEGLTVMFVAVLMISNLVGQKICAFGPFRVSGAQLLFPLTYIFGDVFTEVYGYAASRRAIWYGFFASALLAVIGMIVVALPPAPGWPNQAAFATVFQFVPRLVGAGLLAYWFGEFANSFVLAKMKILTQGRLLWTRTIGSTVVGQGVDTAVVIALSFGGTLRPATLGNLIVSAYLFKVAYETAMTPVTYAVVNFLKDREGVDWFDYTTDFNPFVREASAGNAYR